MKSDAGFVPEDASGSDPTARRGPSQGAFPPRRRALSTQKMYELKTKLRCSCEGRGGGVGGMPGAGLQAGHQGTSPAPAFPQTWWTRPSPAAAAGLTGSTSSACSASGSRCSGTCSVCR